MSDESGVRYKTYLDIKIEEIESRLTALEQKRVVVTTQSQTDPTMKVVDVFVAKDMPDALEQGKPAEDEPKREWQAFYQTVWCYYRSGETGKMVVIDWSLLEDGDLWMPYHDGDEPPAPPKEGGDNA